MNEKIVGWIAIGVILLLGGWLYKSGLLNDQQMQVIIAVLLALGLVYRFVALRTARLTVLKHRLFYKELWKRGEKSDKPEDLIKNKSEEESVVLLGRIKSAMPMTIIMTATAAIAIFFTAHFFASIIAIGQIFLAAKLQWIARWLDMTLPADHSRRTISVKLPRSSSDRYIVTIDMEKVHDFIKPTAALPFWDMIEAKLWLTRCGFEWIGGGRWAATSSAFAYLDTDEVISIHPLETDTE